MPASRQRCTDIAFFLPQLGMGGVGKMRVRLANALARRGYRVDLGLGKADGPYLAGLEPGIEVLEIGTTHALASLPRLVAYLRRRRPKVAITDRLRLNIAVIRSVSISRVASRVYTSVHVPQSDKVARLEPRKRKAAAGKLKRYLSSNAKIITVSEGLREDLIASFDLAAGKITTIYNPVVDERLLRDASGPVSHPFFEDACVPVLLAVGRLTAQKGFPTLLRALARVREERACRLIILGEGRERRMLRALASDLGLSEHVSLPGFTDNPYAYMARADQFVLSSAWEGFGNALVEALAVGTPVVATDCRFGPREILADGAYGPLVPVGDSAALASAILSTLDDPLPSETLRGGSQRFTLDRAVDDYLDVFGLNR